MKIPAGMIVKQIIDEKGLKAKEVGEKMSVSRQAVYQSYAKMVFSDNEIERWSAALGVTKEDFLNRWNNTNTGEGGNDSNYLLEHLTSLEEQFKRLLNQLDVKDRQIEKLMDLLGKHNGVIKLRASRNVMRLIPEMGETA